MTRINPIIPKREAFQNDTEVEGLRELANRIKTQWDRKTPEELASEIIDLEDRVALAKETPGMAKVRKVAEDLHFQFVSPLVRDFKAFAKRIHQTTAKILREDSIAPFNALSPTQKREIIS